MENETLQKVKDLKNNINRKRMHLNFIESLHIGSCQIILFHNKKYDVLFSDHLPIEKANFIKLYKILVKQSIKELGNELKKLSNEKF